MPNSISSTGLAAVPALGLPKGALPVLRHSHAIRGKDHAAARCCDEIMQRARGEAEKSKAVN
jgi:hypothetical protein